MPPNQSNPQGNQGTKPNFDHPQPQSNQPTAGQVFSYTPDANATPQALADLRQEMLRLFSTHIHNGNQSRSINANTDIIGWRGMITYGGTVASTGSLTSSFPLGWSAVRNSLGNYTITHNLNTTNYSMVATSQNDHTTMEVNTMNANTVNVLAWNAGSAIDSTFNFILTVLPL
jgi:hypothetical protein